MNPDPSIVRVGSEYFLTTSSFEYFPSCPVYHSYDLVHWERIGYALGRPEQFAALHDEHPSTYACTLRYHNGRFYAITTDVRGGGNFLVSAENPTGPWSLPVKIDQGMFDPSLLFDNDGKVYYTRRGPDESTPHRAGRDRCPDRQAEFGAAHNLAWHGEHGRRRPSPLPFRRVVLPCASRGRQPLPAYGDDRTSQFSMGNRLSHTRRTHGFRSTRAGMTGCAHWGIAISSTRPNTSGGLSAWARGTSTTHISRWGERRFCFRWSGTDGLRVVNDHDERT